MHCSARVRASPGPNETPTAGPRFDLLQDNSQSARLRQKSVLHNFLTRSASEASHFLDRGGFRAMYEEWENRAVRLKIEDFAKMAERRGIADRRTSDRRRSLRSPIDCQIRLLSAATPSRILSGSLLDASSSGLRLILAHSIEVGEKLLIEARRGARVVCNITVQVVWIESESPNEFRVGCELLTDLSPRQLSQLKSVATESVVRT